MNCEEAQRSLSAYLDGELPPQAAGELRRHLSECAQCAGGLEELRRLEAALDALPGTYVPAGFARRVREAAQAGRVRRMPFGGTLTRAAAVLMAVAGLYCGVQTGRAVGGGPAQDVSATDALDYQADALSAVPTGSLADVYLALGEGEEGSR